MEIQLSGGIPPTWLAVALDTFLEYPPTPDLIAHSIHQYEGGTR